MNGIRTPIQVRVNDETLPAHDGQALLDFIADLGMSPTGILIERNGTALLKGEWPQTLLSDGDRLEILRVVAGG